MILTNERSDIERVVCQKPFIDQLQYFDDILRTVQCIGSSEVCDDRVLFSLLEGEFKSLLHLDGCSLQLIKDQNLANPDTSISPYSQSHASASSGTMNFISEMNRPRKMLRRHLIRGSHRHEEEIFYERQGGSSDGCFSTDFH